MTTISYIPTPEMRLKVGQVQVAEAQLEIARQALTEERKKGWMRIPFICIRDIVNDETALMILTEFDWASGQFEMEARAVLHRGILCIGGYPNNDRFRGCQWVYVPIAPETKGCLCLLPEGA